MYQHDCQISFTSNVTLAILCRTLPIVRYSYYPLLYTTAEKHAYTIDCLDSLLPTEA